MIAIFMYFLFPHWVPATWRSRRRTSSGKNRPSGKVPTMRGPAADLPVLAVCFYERMLPARFRLKMADSQNSPVAYIKAESAQSGAVSQRRMRLPSVQIFSPASAACRISSGSKPPSGPVRIAAV